MNVINGFMSSLRPLVVQWASECPMGLVLVAGHTCHVFHVLHLPEEEVELNTSSMEVA